MQKYNVGQWINYSAELFLIRGSYKRLYKSGRGQIVRIHPDGYLHVFNGVRTVLIHRTDIIEA